MCISTGPLRVAGAGARPCPRSRIPSPQDSRSNRSQAATDIGVGSCPAGTIRTSIPPRTTGKPNEQGPVTLASRQSPLRFWPGLLLRFGSAKIMMLESAVFSLLFFCCTGDVAPGDGYGFCMPVFNGSEWTCLLLWMEGL